MPLSFKDIKNNAFQFVNDYKDAVKENAESQSFLNEFFEIFGISRKRVASFELPVKVDETSGTKRIDLFWTGVLLVEMKSTGQNLDKAYQQGVGYFKGLKDEELPRYVMVCDLNTFRLYDLEDSKDYAFELADLVDNLHLFDFMQGKQIQEITEFDLNEKAAILLGQLHDALENSGFSGHQLQVFMVRILFCLFAEDTGVFNRHQFTHYLLKFTSETGNDTEIQLHRLFQVLDQDDSQRNKNLIPELNDFPYVNGHLFKERIDMPFFTTEMHDQLIECCLFNWKDISPAIFGSLFQSIMDREARRNLGAHYTSEENILKLIEPLFLNELKAELQSAQKEKSLKKRNQRLIELMAKVRTLTFLDPACGCGNFLIITYRELRRLELQLLQAQNKNQEQGHIALEIDPQIPLNNFYGIEIDEWPARIAEVAMWLTQHQMNVEFAKTFGKEPDLLPLKEHAQIHHANSLELDWSEVIESAELNYIIGNPPFVDRKERSDVQRYWHNYVIGHLQGSGNLDFVANWFYKAALFAKGYPVESAFVSTNSIIMGEQAVSLWQPIIEMGFHLNFGHRTFEWSNESTGKAAVHCVIVGFGEIDRDKKIIFEYTNIKGKPEPKIVDKINPYLINAGSVLIQNRRTSINNALTIQSGNMSNDGGNLILSEEERDSYLASYPDLKPWIRPYMGGKEFINGGKRYCLWLTDTGTKQLSNIMNIPEVKERILNVKTLRESSKRAATRAHADTPWLFTEIRQPDTGKYIFIPQVSSGYRAYIPIGFLTSETIPTAPHFIIPNATLYEFGILTSQIHMDWMRTVAGRLKSDYRYSAKLVYNNFPWPEVDKSQQSKIEKLAQAVLDAREVEFTRDPTTSLADLYDPNLMPPTLRKAHQTLDKAVDKLYQSKAFKTPLERVNHLFKLYEELTEGKGN